MKYIWSIETTLSQLLLSLLPWAVLNRNSIGICRNSIGMLTRRTLPHPQPVPNTRTPKNGESMGRCNRPNTTSNKGCLWLRCVLSGEVALLEAIEIDIVRVVPAVVAAAVVVAAVLAVKERKLLVFRRLRVLLSLRVNISEHVPNLN